MTNVLFNRETLRVTGMGREPLPFEMEIKNVDEEGLRNLSKTIEYTEKVQKTDEDGNPLFYLPQDPIEVEVEETVRVQSTEESEEPVIVTLRTREPVLDENNKTVQYEVMAEKITPAVYDEDGNLIEEEKREMVGTGVLLPCYTVKEMEVQDEDEYGNLLYWHTETRTVKKLQEQPLLEIEPSDPRFIEGLEKIMVTVTKTRTVTFEENMNEFTFEDVANFKATKLTEGTFFDKAILFEEPEKVMDTNLSSFEADLGLGFVSFPAKREARTIKLTLPEETDLVGIVTEASKEGLEISIGRLASELHPINHRNEVRLDQPSSEVYVRFKNPTDERIDIYSFGLLT